LADRKKVAEKDGKAFRTHQVQVEDGYRVAADYELTLCEEQEIGATGRLKVVHLVPSKEESSDPCFIGRWDEKANFLDFDPVDREEHVLKDVEFMGHHPTALPDRRFDVEICTGAKLVFKGVVSFGLGRDLGLESGIYKIGG
jgi:hypothetical protein